MRTTLEEWLSYIETLHPQTMELGLERVGQIAEKLKLTHFTVPVITITGTNGKGSCVAFLDAIYSAANYQVGAYTSPHLLEFNERIRIKGRSIDDSALCTAFATVEEKRGDVSLTYFEFTTLAALLIFQSSSLDVILLEVGLGGRLDAVNVVESDIAIITTIALDHEQWLGETREQIAYEKAGIFRSNKPAVCGEFNPPENLFVISAQKRNHLYCINREFNYKQINNSWHWQSNEQTYHSLPIPHLPLQNAATALMAITLLDSQLPVPIQAIHHGLQYAYLPGRFQLFTQPVNCILDVAHNPASAALLAQRLSSTPCLGRTLGVVSVLADKNINDTLKPLCNVVDDWYVAGLKVSRGANAQLLYTILGQLDVERRYQYLTVEQAFAHASAACQANDRIVVFGSFYTVAIVLKILHNNIEII